MNKEELKETLKYMFKNGEIKVVNESVWLGDSWRNEKFIVIDDEKIKIM